jgi:hypothetical protein
MIEDILKLLRLFADRVPDAESNGWVVEVASDEDRWHDAHNYFDKVRNRNLEAITEKDAVRQAQYYFEEMCLKSIWNETDTHAPFDSDSPYWVVPSAVNLARALGMVDATVLEVITA